MWYGGETTPRGGTDETGNNWLTGLAQLSNRFFAPEPAGDTTATGGDTATDGAGATSLPPPKAAPATPPPPSAPSITAPSATGPSTPHVPPIAASRPPPAAEPVAPVEARTPPPPAAKATVDMPNLGWRKAGEVRIFLKRHPTTKQLGFTFDRDAQGALAVTSIAKAHSAEGKMFIGDRLLAVDGTRLKPGASLADAIALIADCKEELVGLVLSDESRFITIDSQGARLGLDLEHSQFPRPVKVLGVAGGSQGEKAGLKFDDHILSVNDVRTWNMDQCVKLIADGVAKGPIKLQVRSMGTGGAVTPPKGVLPGDRSSSGGVMGKMVRSLSFSKRNKKTTTSDGWSPDAGQGSARGKQFSARKQPGSATKPVSDISSP